MATKLGVSATTVHDWERQGLIRKHPYGADQRSLYELPEDITITKGHGGRGAKGPSFICASAAQGAI